MGYQNGNDNTGIDSNRSNNANSVGRTSKVSELAENTSKCQYERLTNSGLKVVPTGDQVGRGTI